jgi:hypothetical protein
VWRVDSAFYPGATGSFVDGLSNGEINDPGRHGWAWFRLSLSRAIRGKEEES